MIFFFLQLKMVNRNEEKCPKNIHHEGSKRSNINLFI